MVEVYTETTKRWKIDHNLFNKIRDKLALQYTDPLLAQLFSGYVNKNGVAIRATAEMKVFSREFAGGIQGAKQEIEICIKRTGSYRALDGSEHDVDDVEYGSNDDCICWDKVQDTFYILSKRIVSRLVEQELLNGHLAAVKEKTEPLKAEAIYDLLIAEEPNLKYIPMDAIYPLLMTLVKCTNVYKK